MSFGKAVSTAFRKYATFSGRARRAEYWWFALFVALVSIPFSIWMNVFANIAMLPAMEYIDPVTGAPTEGFIEAINWGQVIVGYAPYTVMSLALLLPNLSITVRRLHDTNRSGWWVLLTFVPVLSIVPLVFMFFDSQSGPNQYGEDPKAGERWQPYPPGTVPPLPGHPQASATPAPLGYAQEPPAPPAS